MINIAICDDCVRVCKEIEDYLFQYGNKYKKEFYINVFHSGEDLLSSYDGQYDIIIFDVEMKKLDGIETAKRVRQRDEQVIILFSTAHREYAIDGYKVDASGYLLKPVGYEDVEALLLKILQKLQRKKQEILIQMGGESRKEQISSILYIDYYKHKVTYYFMNGKNMEGRGTLKEILEHDSSSLLIQIHKNCIINKLWIQSCNNRMIYLKGISTPFEVSRPKWKMIENEYIEFCIEKII